MKKLFTALLILVPFICSAQENIIKPITDKYYNFSVVEKNVIWQFVYETNKTHDEIIKHFKQSRDFTIIESDSLNIRVFVEKRDVNYRKYNYPAMGTYMYLNIPISYDANISIKDNKYMVVVSSLIFAGEASQNSLDGFAYNYKQQRFNKRFISKSFAGVLAMVLYDTFLIKNTIPPSTTDW